MENENTPIYDEKRDSGVREAPKEVREVPEKVRDGSGKGKESKAETPGESRPAKSGKLRLLAAFLRGTKRFYLVAILAAALASLAELIQPQIIRAAVDNALGGKPANFPAFILRAVERIGGFPALSERLWIFAATVLVVALIQVLSQYLFKVYETKATETLVQNMRCGLFSHMEHLPFSWHMRHHTGDIIQRCTSDIDTAKNFVSEQLTSILRTVLMLLLSLFFMFGMHPALTWIAMAPMPVILLYSFFFHNKIGDGFETCDENEGRLSAIAQENLTGVRVVRAFGQERAEIEKFRKQNQYYTALWEKLARLMSRFWCTSDVLSGIQIMLVVVFGAYFCIHGSMSEGEYIAFLSYNAMLVWPIRTLGRMISEMSKAGVSLERIAYIMNSPAETDAPGAYDAPMNGDIAFHNVSFHYENAPDILHNISFEMKSGTVLGILGGTGSGKSTLMLLLDKLYDLEEGQGSITVGGVDIRQIRTEHLRRSIGMVLQEPYLFSGTIKDNIGIATPGITLTEIRAAAHAAAFDKTVMSFPEQYETVVGERGVTLSGGQKQRAAIARLLTGNPPIMIFDDSLSAVDTETDAKIRHALTEHFGKASIILISHRITTLCHAGKILVLEHGRIAEEGTHEELKHAGGIYQKIFEAQSEKEVTET